MDSQVFKKIEYYLYNYEELDKKINDIKTIISNIEYSQNYSKWIKTTSSQLEDQVIRNIELKAKICKLQKWKKLLTFILQNYKKTSRVYYDFINLKYLQKVEFWIIENKLKLNLKQRKDMQASIMQHIFLYAIEQKLVKSE